jgi:hypothetical protein
MKVNFLLFLFIGAVLAVSSSHAQTTRVSGKVTDKLTGEPIPFANVAFKGTSIGSVTDIDGNYVIESDKATDSLTASYVGYYPISLKIAIGKSQTANFLLKVSKVELMEVVVKAGENPANVLLKKIIENKDLNDKRKFDSYTYETYNKMEFDMTDIPEDFKDKKLIKPFAFIFDNIDSSVTNSKPFLPFFITESLSDIYYRKTPRAKKEIIKASKISGLENETITQFLGDMYQNVDIYSNYMDIFGKSFVSPISNIGTVYYKYYLLDSAFIDNQWCYKLKFKPRRKQELTFIGECWVHDTTFAIKKIDMRVAVDANINFIEDLAVVKQYTRIDDEYWMLEKELLVVDFAPTKEGIGFIGRKTTSYKDIKINVDIPQMIFAGSADIEVKTTATEQEEDFWNEARHDSLSDREKRIYHMVDTIKSLPAFKTYIDIITLFVTGYKQFGKVEVGPYFTLLSFNSIEGYRIRLGGRTSHEFSERLRLEGYVAYGTRDETFKYKLGFRYFLNTRPRESIGASYKNDVEQFGQSENAFQDDNFLASLFRRLPTTKLSKAEYMKTYYEREWISGYSHRLTFAHGIFAPLGTFDYSYYTNDEKTTVQNNLNISQVSLRMRFAYREKFVEGKRGRISLGSDYPVVQVNFTVGLKDVLDSDFNYQKIEGRIEDNIKLPPFGYTYLAFEAGKTWGTVPYPLLDVHIGNESYFYDYSAFNMMNFYEFVSDQYVSINAVHHFDGFFFNKIPLMRKLKWRELVTLRGVAGSMREENLDILVNPDAFYALSKPYFEAGFGIENIIKIVRLDFIYRLSFLDNPNVSKFGVRGSLQLNF